MKLTSWFLTNARNVADAAGSVLLAIGCGLIYLPAGIIVMGALLLFPSTIKVILALRWESFCLAVSQSPKSSD